jgi:hypothetical protein
MPDTTNKPLNAKAYLTEIGWLQENGNIDNRNLENDDPIVCFSPDFPVVMLEGKEIDIEKIVALGHYLSNYVKD